MMYLYDREGMAMPRKVGLGPAILRIEGLSDGVDYTLRDDWTGEVLPQPQARPPRVDDAFAVRDAFNKRKVEMARALLNGPKPKPQGILMRTKAGDELRLIPPIRPAKPFRRF